MPDVKICSCILGRYPKAEIVKEQQLPLRSDKEMRCAVFLLVSSVPWEETCPCTFAACHISEPLNASATPIEHGEGRDHQAQILFIHRDTLREATAVYELFVAGLSVEDYQARYPGPGWKDMEK